MIRSVLKVTPAQFQEIQSKMSTKGAKARKTRDNFFFSDYERSALSELQALLELFERPTNDFQSNQVSISRVYPAINTLMVNLTKNIESYVHTSDLRIELRNSLKERFGDLIEGDVFTASTFLDPKFNIQVFSPVKRAEIIPRVKILVRAQISLSEQVPVETIGPG